MLLSTTALDSTHEPPITTLAGGVTTLAAATYASSQCANTALTEDGEPCTEALEELLTLHLRGAQTVSVVSIRSIDCSKHPLYRLLQDEQQGLLEEFTARAPLCICSERQHARAPQLSQQKQARRVKRRRHVLKQLHALV